MRNMKVMKQGSEPSKFAACGGHGTVFGLSRRTRKRLLFLGFPGDEGITKKNTKTRDGSPGIWTASPITITKCLELKIRIGGK